MTSQISLNKLMKIDFRSRRWLFILSAVVQTVFGPISGLMSITTKGNYTIRYAIERAFEYEYAIFESGIVLVGAILLSVIGFRFLFSKRMMDLYGSIPVSRSKMFLAVYLNNLLSWQVPFVASLLLTSLMCIACDSSFTASILLMAAKYFASGVFAFLIVYHMCLVAVMISGHAFVAIANILMMGVSVLAIYGIIYYYASSFFNTFVEFAVKSAEVAWLSPVAAVYYVPGMVNDDYLVGTDYLVFTIGSILLLIANFVLARFLFIKRKSELAEGGVKIRPYIIVVRSAVALISGVYLSFIFALFAIGTIHIWSIVGIVIGVLAGFGIVNMILYRTGRAFFKDKFIMIGTLVGSILFYVIFAADLIGYDRYVPAEKYIAKAEIIFPTYYDDGARLVVEDGKVVEQNWRNEIPSYTTEDAEYIHQLLTAGAREAAERENNWVSIWESISYEESYDPTANIPTTQAKVKVYLSNGTSYYRIYHIDNSEKEMLTKVIESEEYRNTNYPLSTGNFSVNPDRINFYSFDEYVDFSNYEIEDPELIEMIFECYRRDFAENEIFDRPVEYSMECQYIIYDEQMEDSVDEYGNIEDFYHYSYVSLYINDDYSRTKCVIALVKNINYTEFKYNQEDIEEYLKGEVQAILDEG